MVGDWPAARQLITTVEDARITTRLSGFGFVHGIIVAGHAGTLSLGIRAWGMGEMNA